MKFDVYNATVDDAVNVMKHYTEAARDSIVAGLYGPREARFAALIMFLVDEREKTAASRSSTAAISAQYEERIRRLLAQQARDSTRLAKLSTIIEESVAGGTQLVHDIMGNR